MLTWSTGNSRASQRSASPGPKRKSPGKSSEPQPDKERLPAGKPSAPGRGAAHSVTNPEVIPKTNKFNPFFETMPAPEQWHRNMPPYFPFGETPFMQQEMSRQISEDLARGLSSTDSALLCPLLTVYTGNQLHNDKAPKGNMLTNAFKSVSEMLPGRSRESSEAAAPPVLSKTRKSPFTLPSVSWHEIQDGLAEMRGQVGQMSENVPRTKKGGLNVQEEVQRMKDTTRRAIPSQSWPSAQQAGSSQRRPSRGRAPGKRARSDADDYEMSGALG